jgi:adenylate kinase
MNIVLFGPPGAGKGTQSSLLVDRLEMLQISTGDLFRSNITRQTALGNKAKNFMDAGLLVPDEVTIEMVRVALSDSRGKSFILDGFPRNLIQARALDQILLDLEKSVEKAIFIDVPHAVLLTRLTGRRVCQKCGEIYHIEVKKPKNDGVCDLCNSTVVQRPDDTKEVIEKRLNVYSEITLPLKHYYTEQKKCVVIDGLGEVEAVFGRVKKELKY